MKNGKINTKLKVIIIVFYTVVIFGLVLLLFGTDKNTRFKDYGTTPYDEFIALNVREVENRKSKFATGSSGAEGEHEKATFDFQITIVRLQVYAYIENMNIFVSAKTATDNYCFDETSTNKTIGAGTYTSLVNYSTFATRSIEKCTEDGATEEYLVDETPKEIYVKINYDVKKNNQTQTKTLEYKVSVLDLNIEKKIKNIEFRSINKENVNFVDSKDDPFSIKFTKNLTDETSKVQNVKEDNIKVEFRANTANLNKVKHSEEYLKGRYDNKDYITAIELPKIVSEMPEGADEKEYWNIAPEIKEIKFEVYGKIDNKDSEFSQYVKFYSFYGFLSRYRAPSLLTYRIDESFNLSEIYVVAEGVYHNATEEKFSVAFAVKVEDLASML